MKVTPLRLGPKDEKAERKRIVDQPAVHMYSKQCQLLRDYYNRDKESVMKIKEAGLSDAR